MAKDYAKEFYKSTAWVKCRNSFMDSKNNVCERCGDVAVICHHKEHITPDNISDQNITLNWDNLQALCIECHNAIHGKSQTIRDDLTFDSAGNLQHTPHSERDSIAKRNRDGAFNSPP